LNKNAGMCAGHVCALKGNRQTDVYQTDTLSYSAADVASIQ